MIHEQLPQAMSRSMGGASILLIDDDEHISEALTLLLEARGHTVQRCYRAQEGLALLQAGHRPDLILLDLNMPGMSGWEFRIEQRQQPAFADIPVIAMSGERSAQAVAIDADAYLPKPIDERTLFRAVDEQLAAARHKASEARGAELERLSSLGLIAAGIAHEINNPLSFVIGNLELARRHARDLEKELSGLTQARAIALGRLLEKVDRGAERIADMVRSVSAYSRPDMDEIVPINVVDVLESSIQLVENELRHRGKLERDYSATPLVLGNPAQLGQVFVNLLTNAAHALGDDERRKQEVRVATYTGPSGESVITISDTGQGIPPALLARIFDPFFSTKPSGGGMGLGLAISERIVRSMGGKISAQSSLGLGSTFVITLPAQQSEQELAAAPQQGSTPPQPPASLQLQPEKQRAKILVVDDEEMMCELLREMLREDYDVEVEVSARRALETMLGGASYDLILCDLMMPELSGMDVHAELARRRADQAERMVFMTGGTFTERAQRFVEHISTACLNKPFRPPEVYSLIDSLLAARGLLGESAVAN